LPIALRTVPLPSVMETFTNIECLLPFRGDLRLRIYDVAGRVVREIPRTTQGPGRVTIRWDGQNEQGTRVPAGIYFYRLETGSMAASHAVVVVR
jgi:flagellar hook assembly protein FlgD